MCSRFVCIPIVLIGRLYGSSLWGFLSACLARITHSYYNRTLAGYYDTDMFSITAPAFAMYFLLAASRKRVNRIFISRYHKFILIRILLWICSGNYLCFSPDFFGLSMGLFLLDFLTLSKKISGLTGKIFYNSIHLILPARQLFLWLGYFCRVVGFRKFS